MTLHLHYWPTPNGISQRPAVQRGLAVGKDLPNDPSTLTPEETERRAKLLYNQRARPVPARSRP
jgi:GSH-dependent disulfide-bond oxidoreductase